MNWINEEKLIEVGFTQLANGMLVLIDVFKDEITDMVVAYRSIDCNMIPQKGWFVSGIEWSEYFEDMDELKKFLVLS